MRNFKGKTFFKWKAHIPVGNHSRRNCRPYDEYWTVEITARIDLICSMEHMATTLIYVGAYYTAG